MVEFSPVPQRLRNLLPDDRDMRMRPTPASCSQPKRASATSRGPLGKSPISFKVNSSGPSIHLCCLTLAFAAVKRGFAESTAPPPPMPTISGEGTPRLTSGRGSAIIFKTQLVEAFSVSFGGVPLGKANVLLVGFSSTVLRSSTHFLMGLSLCSGSFWYSSPCAQAINPYRYGLLHIAFSLSHTSASVGLFEKGRCSATVAST